MQLQAFIERFSIKCEPFRIAVPLCSNHFKFLFVQILSNLTSGKMQNAVCKLTIMLPELLFVSRGIQRQSVSSRYVLRIADIRW